MRLLLLSLALAGCVDQVEGGECNLDGDCSADFPSCVFDLNQNKTYCSRGCVTTADCPRDMSCRIGVTEDLSGVPEVGICIRRVRDCSGAEVCNGLDDDCNGVIDDPGCTLVTDCNDDLTCGGFVCSAPPNQPTTVCTPPIPTAGDYFDTCTGDDQCPNALCSAGFCSPLCRARGDSNTECDGQLACARGMGSRARPLHNICQPTCDSPAHCDAPTKCVWRDIHEPADVDHVAVCSLIDPERKPLGESCPFNNVETDDECQYGLCFGNVCTRICGGPGADCSDVGPDFVCEERELIYANSHFRRICVRQN